MYLNYDVKYREGSAPGEWYWQHAGFRRVGLILHLATILPAGLLVILQVCLLIMAGHLYSSGSLNLWQLLIRVILVHTNHPLQSHSFPPHERVLRHSTAHDIPSRGPHISKTEFRR